MCHIIRLFNYYYYFFPIFQPLSCARSSLSLATLHFLLEEGHLRSDSLDRVRKRKRRKKKEGLDYSDAGVKLPGCRGRAVRDEREKMGGKDAGRAAWGCVRAVIRRSLNIHCYTWIGTVCREMMDRNSLSTCHCPIAQSNPGKMHLRSQNGAPLLLHAAAPITRLKLYDTRVQGEENIYIYAHRFHHSRKYRRSPLLTALLLLRIRMFA